MGITSLVQFETSDYNVFPGQKLNKEHLNKGANRLKLEALIYDDYIKFLLEGFNASIAAWIIESTPYEKDVLVKHNNVVWRSLQDNNSDEPTGASVKWENLIFYQGPRRIDIIFDTYDISNMTYDVKGLLTDVDYVTGNKIHMSYNVSDLLTTVEYFDTDGITLLSTSTLTYDGNNQLNTTTWTNE